jgi:hypothetical protein
MKRLITSLTACAIIFVQGRDARADFIFNPAADFSTTSNPNGVWSFGSEPTGTPGAASISLFTTYFVYNGAVGMWNNGGLLNNGLPLTGLVSENLTNSTYTDNMTVWEPGQLVFHAGGYYAPPNTFAVVRFTAPTAGTYTIQSVFSNQSVGGYAGQAVAVYEDGIALFGGTLGSYGSTATMSPLMLTLNAGDYVDFLTGVRGDGTANSVSTGLDAQITELTATPEPASLTLFGLAAASLGAYSVGKRALRRRRRVGKQPDTRR